MAIAKDSYEICLRCGESNREGTSRCQKCKAPLDTSARDHPWEMKTANHHAYAAATSPKVKPIIFWGAWLFFGPSALYAIFLVYLTFVFDSPLLKFDFDTFVALALPLGYGLMASWALWSVTKGYLGKKPSSEFHP
ncbi:MAG: ribosomal protein L37E [Akkermansiaceae bacterium]|jgi:ribosomal protein L37E